MNHNSEINPKGFIGGDVPRVLLVQAGNPSRAYPFRSHPLGMMYLASALRKKHAGLSIWIIDMKVNRISPASVADMAARERFNVIGIGGFSVHADIMNETAAAVRAVCPAAVMLAGGPHASGSHDGMLRGGVFDAVVVGEGEETFSTIVSSLSEGKNIPDAPGVACLREGEISYTGPAAPLNPDDIPFPAWDLIERKAYSDFSSFSILGRRNYMSLFTSRGCPFGCIYCHNLFGRKFRPRSAENVGAEVRELIEKHGIRDFDILDDVFNFQRERVHRICEELLALGKPLMLAFPNGLRSDLLDDETLAIMRRAGTRYISFAIESAAPRLQKFMKKNLNVEKAERAIRTAARLGIFCNGFFMLGFPTETVEELQATSRFAVKSPLHTAHFLKVTCFGGTEMSKMTSGSAQNATDAPADAHKYYDRSFNLSTVPNERFNRFLATAHRRFYFNPLRLLRLVMAHPRKMNLMHFAAFAVRRIVFASDKG